MNFNLQEMRRMNADCFLKKVKIDENCISFLFFYLINTAPVFMRKELLTIDEQETFKKIKEKAYAFNKKHFEYFLLDSAFYLNFEELNCTLAGYEEAEEHLQKLILIPKDNMTEDDFDDFYDYQELFMELVAEGLNVLSFLYAKKIMFPDTDMFGVWKEICKKADIFFRNFIKLDKKIFSFYLDTKYIKTIVDEYGLNNSDIDFGFESAHLFINYLKEVFKDGCIDDFN